MIEWVKLSSLIIDQLFNYVPKINDIFKSKESKHKQFQIKILCNDIANQIQKNLLDDLKTMMDYSVNIPLKKEDSDELIKVTKNIIEIESNNMQKKMKELIISQFNDILVDNLLCAPKYHNLVIVGSNIIYKIINKLYNDDITIKDNIEKYQLFCARKAEFRSGLLLYALNISDQLDLARQAISPLDLNKNEKNKNVEKNDKDNNNNKSAISNMKKVSKEILVFIKNLNKKFENDINRKISGIMICVNNKEEYENLKELIDELQLSIKKYKFKLDIYLIIINKCIEIPPTFNNDNNNNIISNTNDNNINIENNNINNENDNIMNNDNNNFIINNDKNDDKVKEDVKIFPISIEDQNIEILDEEENKKEIEHFLNELVNKYIDDYTKDNIDNIECTLNLQFSENLKYYYEKVEKEFNNAALEMKNFNLKNVPLKVEFESQTKKIFTDIFINYIYPISTNPNINNSMKNQLSNQSLNQINDFFNYILQKVKALTGKGKDEYSMRLIREVKVKIDELFSQLRLDEGEKEKVDEQNKMKKNFTDNIIQSLNEKIVFSSDVYDLCLAYVYISKDLFNVLYEKISEFCEKTIFKNKEFKKGIIKRIQQQIDNCQRKALNIN
jgi:hypothetical protein